jgi:hypothetical protein
VVGIQEVSYAAASASVVIAALYYIWQIRHQNKMRMIDATSRLYAGTSVKESVEAFSRLVSAEYADYDEFVERYGPMFSDSIIGVFLWLEWLE